MQHDVDVMVEDERWDALDFDAHAGAAVQATLTHLNAPTPSEVVIMACDDARIAELNTEFRSKPQPTNVLSWPSYQFPDVAAGSKPTWPPMPELGDIAIAFETCMAEAKTLNRTPNDHLTHLIVHGTLHLLGYDHINDADAELMEGTEVEILETLGISNPYIDHDLDPKEHP